MGAQRRMWRESGVKFGFLMMALAIPLMMGAQQKSGSGTTVPEAPLPATTNNLKVLASRVVPGEGTQAPSVNLLAPPQQPAPEIPPGEEQKEPPVVPAPGELSKDIATFVANVNFVTVPVTVLDKHDQQVAGLTWRDFQIYENNQRQRIAVFSADPVPLSVALVIDQSLPKDVMRKVNQSLAAIPGAFTPSDEIAVFTYSDGVSEPTDFTRATGARLPAVLQASKRSGETMGVPVLSGPFASGPVINGQTVDPNLTPQRSAGGPFLVLPKPVHTLNDAILAAGEALATRPKDRRRIIYVISDGKESRSKAGYKEVVRYLQAHRIAVYGTLVGDSATWGLGYLDKLKIPLLPFSPDDILPKYAAATGGQLEAQFSEDGIQKSFAHLAMLARTEYTLGYYSHLSLLDSKFRTIDVRVLRPNLQVIAEKGYYPTPTALNR